MAFGSNAPAIRVSADRLAGVVGATPPAPADNENARPRPRALLEPDTSRIRPICIDESPELRKKRLAAKTVNFSATIFARIVILSAAGLYAWKAFEFSGEINRGLAFGLLALLADLGRVSLKALEPGSK